MNLHSLFTPGGYYRAPITTAMPKTSFDEVAQSKTPRTDRWEYEQECNYDVPWEDNCRTLETELTDALAALKKLLAAAETCQEHCYSDGMVHHKSFNTLAIGEAILGARHILSLAATANPKPEELGQ